MATVLATLALGACEVTRSPAITAQVVDSANDHPLSHVRVLALWPQKGGVEGGTLVGYAAVLEAETDDNGVFTIPAWERRVVRSVSDPLLFVFKPGYAPQMVPPPTSSRAPYVAPYFDGPRVRIAREANETRIQELLRVFAYDIDGLARMGRLDSAAHFVCEVAAYNDELAWRGRVNTIPSRQALEADAKLDCGRIAPPSPPR
jgi:hypothetical protein